MSLIQLASLFESLGAVFAPHRCVGCLEPVVAAELFCEICRIAVEPLPRLAPAIFEYGGPVSDAILRAKRNSRAVDLRDRLADEFASIAKDRYAGRVDAVVAPPVNLRRAWRRRCDFSALLAQRAARTFGVAEYKGLRRARAMHQQTGLSGSVRRENLRDAFVASNAPRRILVVDDVVSTGATMAAIEAALTNAGAERVLRFSLALNV